ncbi:hypothetical protein [Brevibacillus antibioticus]|uniref:hypothetical protein n=1 Tax=Brevibacillus antibioticus TaxID=2570228 RepID=UPI00313433C0
MLIDVVEDGASLGFLPPMQLEEARAYWTLVPHEHVKIWVAVQVDVIVETNQLYLSMGYQEAGRVPEFARSDDGSYHDTVLYFKTIE